MGEKEIIFRESDKDFRSRKEQRKIIGVMMAVLLPASFLFVIIAITFSGQPLSFILAFDLILLPVLIGFFFFFRWYFRAVEQGERLIIYRDENGDLFFDVNKHTIPIRNCVKAKVALPDSV